MGLTNSTYHECQEVTWTMELTLGNIQDKKNMFKWERVVKNLPGTSTYDCCQPWVYKERSNGSIADNLFVYVYNGRPIGTTDEVCWEESRKWGSKRSWMGIQYASRKVHDPSQEPRPWEGTATHTKEGVFGLVSQYRWDKVKRLVQVLVDTEDKEEGGLEKAKMVSIRELLVYVARTYRDMNPYLKGFYLTIYSWRPFRENKGWIMQGEKLKLLEMDRIWEMVE